MYKRIVSLIALCFCCIFVFAQTYNKNIAPFKIEMVNGKQFTYQQLQKNKPVILIYFSPTCDHCKAFTKELLQHEKELASKQIIMVTYVPIEEVKPFVSDFNLNNYSNIKAGTEGYSFIVRKYYNVERFPFVALFNKQMQLEKVLPYSEDNAATVSQILKL